MELLTAQDPVVLDTSAAIVAAACLAVCLILLTVACVFGAFDDDGGKAASDRRLADLRRLDETDEEVDR